jgi:hypothetical protein
VRKLLNDVRTNRRVPFGLVYRQFLFSFTDAADPTKVHCWTEHSQSTT